ncbi:MAG: hypothetical protein GTN49_07150 [candidate division Zixibacteria bacterium]|nr:hypothetical protein [candidate division Zixibacteria bacterium]
MRKLTVLFFFGIAAATAYGIGVGAGGFGGIALPMGDMASEDGSDLGMSPKFGGKALIGVIPALDVEVAFAYHLSHKYKDWEDIPGVDEPKTTIIPITFGANYKLMFGDMGVYFGGGGGFYMMKMGVAGELEIPPFPDPVIITGDVDVNKPGIYFGGGFLYSFGKLALDVSPRFNYVMNSGDFEGPGEATIEGETYEGTITLEKDYKDMYVDVLFGVDYFFM